MPIFEPVVTVVNTIPYKFTIMGEENDEGTNDPLNEKPYIYKIYDSRVYKNSEVINIHIKPSSTLIDTVFNGINERLHFHSVKFGIDRIRSRFKEKEFIFTTDDYNAMDGLAKLTGDRLRLEVLKFYFDVNRLLPSLSVNIDDLTFSIHAEKEEIFQWAEDLAAQDYFSPSIKTVPQRFKGGKMGAYFYRINPKNRDEIKKELNDAMYQSGQSSPLIFLSYNTIDKVLAGQLKSELESRGLKCFLAHDDIEPSEPWQIEILRNLENCSFLIAIITDEFRKSKWTDQEVGHAIGTRKRIIPLFQNETPHGFLNQIQGINITNKDISSISIEITKIIENVQSPYRS